ncbi:MAG: hypothetical protein IJM10_00775 [Clostridia bacterium]|nr:hypothetical protein [Clostridia bacterium]
MTKKLLLFIITIFLLFICSCGKTERSISETNYGTSIPVAEEGATGVESQEALNLKYLLPEYEFNEIIEEHYEESSKDYYLNAKASKQQFDEYVDLCVKAGFVHRLDGESDSLLYNAYSDNGAEIDVSYSEKNSEIFVLIYKRNA